MQDGDILKKKNEGEHLLNALSLDHIPSKGFIRLAGSYLPGGQAFDNPFRGW
jgi:hypothetical protein